MIVVIGFKSVGDLFKVGFTFCVTSFLSGRRKVVKTNGSKDADDGNDDEKFEKGEAFFSF